MQLTTKGRYAVTALLDLAVHSSTQPVKLSEISHRQGISQSYLEQLFAQLRRQNLVTGVRGPGGGYQLARPAVEIKVSDVIHAVDEQTDSTNCGGKGNCHDNRRCLTHELWMDLSQQINTFLDDISFADLLVKRSVLEVSKRQTQRNLNTIHLPD